MAIKKVITSNDFADDDFIIQNNKVNLHVVNRSFTGNWKTNVYAGNNSDEQRRRELRYQNGLGVFHLDFRVTNGTSPTSIIPLFELTAGAPTPRGLLEFQLFDGANIWIENGGRILYGERLTVNRRYIVNLVGFFNEPSA